MVLAWELKRMKHIQGFACRVFLTLFAVLLLAFTLCICGYGQRAVGVEVGDWAEYTVTGAFQGNVTNPFENVASMRVTVVNVVDTNVTVDAHFYFENGSDTVEPGWIDVETGNGTYQGWLIAANLNAGDRVYTDNETMFGEMTINETITREYLGSMLEVNHFIINVTVPSNPFYNMSVLMDWYWYRDSGVVAEMRMYTLMELMGNTTMIDVSVNLLDVIPEFPVSVYFPFFIITTIALVVLAKIRTNLSL
jgi:hypothetical protein